MYWVLILAGFFGAIIGFIYLFRNVFSKFEQKFQQENSAETLAVYEKKAPELETSRYSGMVTGLIGNLGLLLALGLVLAAFEWRQYDEINTGEEMMIATVEEEEVMEIPVTEYTPPPPQPIQQPEIEEVEDDEEIEQEEEIILETEIEEEVEVVEQYTGPTMIGGTGNPDDFIEEEEEVDQVFLVAEEDAEFPGGIGEFMKFLATNIKYPNQARRMNVEGVVHVQFVIEKDGSLTDINVVRGLGYGADEEAVRVLKQSPKWTPAKQRGRPVRLKKIVPVRFKLR